MLLIRDLRIKNFCGLCNYYTEFEEIAFAKEEHAEAILSALGILLDNFDITYGKNINANAELSAKVEICGDEYTLCYSNRRKTAYCNNMDVTEDFYKRIRRSLEEQFVSTFHSRKNQGFPTRFFEYREMLKNGFDSIFDKVTDGLGVSTEFYSELTRTVSEFGRTHFAGNDIVLDKNGRFKVLAEGMLSGEDVILYNCYCFFKVAQFWEDIAFKRDIHRVRMPLFVHGVFESIDETKSKAELIGEARRAKRQVLFLG